MTSIVTDRLCGSIPITTALTCLLIASSEPSTSIGRLESGGHRYYQQSIPFFSLSRPAAAGAAHAK